ncbi:MAG TPA: flippase activity-associated protein Agl23, partial [Candidatus Limnocylindrales bacterium]|nr:flippase activity-associated protein Agl23 [Candidatus Limnocylindrales bacterium]
MAQVPAEIRRRKARQKAKGQPPKALPGDQPQLLQARVWGLTLWQWAGTVILFAAAFLRLIFLSHKVLHHDEGVNGLFMVSLFRNGYYHYDPSNYHGPSLYYAGLVTSSIASFFMGKDGLNTFTIRLVPAIFGVGVVWLMLCLRRQLGTFGALCAAALATVSPGFVFFSRYFIHEILFVFFTLGVIVAWLRYRETGQPRSLMLAAASAALLGATKETWVITAGVWLIAIPCTAIYFRLAEKLFSRVPDQEQQAAAVSGSAWTRSELYFYPALLFVG